MVATSGQLTAGEMGKGQFFQRNLAEERVVRKISSPRVPAVPNLYNDQSQWAGNRGKGNIQISYDGFLSNFRPLRI